MTDLLARLHVAEAGSRELDAAIADLFDPVPDQYDGFPGRWPFVEGSQFSDQTPPVTTCVTAALALAERVLPGWAFTMATTTPPWVQAHPRPLNEDNYQDAVLAATLPLALCIAILRAAARQQSPEKEPGT